MGKKIKYENVEILDIPQWWKDVIENDVSEDFDTDMIRRLQWIITHKHDRCLERMKTEWTPRLKAKGMESIPLDDEAFVNLVLAQPEYKNAKARQPEIMGR